MKQFVTGLLGVAAVISAAAPGVVAVAAAPNPNAATAAPSPNAATAAPTYHLAKEVSLPGDDGWDYLAYDHGQDQVFVTHGTRVQVVDAKRLFVLGTVGDTQGVHGVALAPDLGRGYISDGRADSVVVFDLKSLARITTVKTTGANPDAILYDAGSHRVLTFNGRGRNVTALDARKNEVAGTLALDAKPEFAVSDGAGHVFVNLEDKNSIAVIDPQKLAVTSTWALDGCDSPSGLAIDREHHRLFSVCDNKVMTVVDSTSGKVITHLPIGARVDAAAYDPGTHLAFASCGDGTLTVVSERSPDVFAVVQTVTTQAGARTMALDDRTHRVFLATAKFGPPPAATAEQPRARPSIVPGSFTVLVLEP
jgi:DNA-binding beta-propeller fold protein YncE